MNIKNLPILILAFVLLLATESRAQCSATIQDSLLPGFDLQLVGIATGVPPFTYTWTVSGVVTGPITYQSNSTTGGAGDSILINAGDLFGNYGCINVNLCITDSTGCTNCAGDTLLAFPGAAPCYSGFTYFESTPGTIQVMMNQPVPPMVGFSIGTYTDDMGNSANLSDGNNWTFTYNPTTMNPNGYDIPMCIQTYFFYTPSVFCISCDTIHVSPILGVQDLATETGFDFTIFPNPTKDFLQLTVGKKDFAGVAELYNLTGTLVRSYNLTKSSEVLDLQAIENGAYLIRLSSEKATMTKFFVKGE